MTSYKVNSYLNLLGKTPEYENLFSIAHQIHSNQIIFFKFIPSHLAPHCHLSRISNGRLTIWAGNGAIATKLKQISPSLLLKLQELEWEVTSIHILVQAHYFTRNTKPLIDKGYVKKEIKLSKTGKECLNQLATTLPSSELKSTIQSFLQKHRDD